MVGLSFQVQKVVFLGSCGKIMLSCKLLTGLLALYFGGGGRQLKLKCNVLTCLWAFSGGVDETKA